MYYKVHKFKEGGTLLWAYDNTVDAVDVSINITTGSQADTIPGITHFLEHMLFTGTVNRNEEELKNTEKGLHNHQNGATSTNYVNVNFCAPTREIERSMEHNGDMLVNSTFPEDKIEREKGPVIAEMRFYEDSGKSYRDLFNDNLFKYVFDFNLTENDVNPLGTEESVRSITRQDLIDYRNKYFNRGNLVICMYGNITYEKAKELSKKYVVSKLPEKGEMFIPKMMDAKLQPRSNLIHAYVPLKSAYLQVCFPFAGKQNFKSAMLSHMLNIVLRDRLTEVLRYKNGLVYTPFVQDIQFLNDGLKVIDLQVPSEKTNETIRLVAKLVGDLVKEGISQEEFLNIKQNYLDADKFGSSNYIFGKTDRMYQSYLNNDRIYSDREKRNIVQFISCQDLNEHLTQVLSNPNAIVNFMGDRFPEEMYNPQQIQALFLLNRYSKEELKQLYGYTVPDMGCPGEYVRSDETNPWGYKNEQLLLEQFDEKKVKHIAKKIKEYNAKCFPKTKKVFYDELTKKQKEKILNDLKENNIVVTEEELKNQVFEVENNEKPQNLILEKFEKRKNNKQKTKKVAYIRYEDLTPYKKELVKATLKMYGLDLNAISSNINALTVEELAKMMGISVEQLIIEMQVFDERMQQLEQEKANNSKKEEEK